MDQTKMTDAELWQALDEADQRRADGELPLDVRIRSFETYSICLREADYRGYNYAGLRAAALSIGSRP